MHILNYYTFFLLDSVSYCTFQKEPHVITSCGISTQPCWTLASWGGAALGQKEESWEGSLESGGLSFTTNQLHGLQQRNLISLRLTFVIWNHVMWPPWSVFPRKFLDVGCISEMLQTTVNQFGGGRHLLHVPTCHCSVMDVFGQLTYKLTFFAYTRQAQKTCKPYTTYLPNYWWVVEINMFQPFFS